MTDRLTHLDASGRAAMVDIAAKPVTERVATAQGEISMQPATLALILDGGLPKGDVVAVARIAGIMAAKKTADLIPLCHALPLSSVAVEFRFEADRVVIEATARISGQTGVEMEALTAVSVAALTLYDMCKSVDRGMVIGQIRLTHKSGGKSGRWDAP